jgi:hypothetical protein
VDRESRERSPRDNPWRVVGVAAVAAFLSFWGGYGLRVLGDNEVLRDHEQRVRQVEKTLMVLASDIRDIKTIVTGLQNRQEGGQHD